MLTSSSTRTRIQQVIDEYSLVFVVLLALQFITYGYYFTTLIFTNHTFPNSLLYQYPSFEQKEKVAGWRHSAGRQHAQAVLPLPPSAAVVIHHVHGRVLAVERHAPDGSSAD